MLYELQIAIFTQYNSTAGATLRGLTAGLFEDIAPSSVVLQTQAGENLTDTPVLPFIVFTEVFTSLFLQNFCTNFEEPLVQFTVFGDGNNKTSKEVLLIGKEFLNVYGDRLFSMGDGYTMIRNDTVGRRKFNDTDKMWNYVIELLFQIEKTR